MTDKLIAIFFFLIILLLTVLLYRLEDVYRKLSTREKRIGGYWKNEANKARSSRDDEKEEKEKLQKQIIEVNSKQFQEALDDADNREMYGR